MDLTDEKGSDIEDVCALDLELALLDLDLAGGGGCVRGAIG